jgi:hypothetical protein
MIERTVRHTAHPERVIHDQRYPLLVRDLQTNGIAQLTIIAALWSGVV